LNGADDSNNLEPETVDQILDELEDWGVCCLLLELAKSIEKGCR